MEAYGWRTNRTLDPVKAAALHEAVFAWRGFAIPDKPEEDPTGEILQVAERFERWLAGTDEAD